MPGDRQPQRPRGGREPLIAAEVAATEGRPQLLCARQHLEQAGDRLACGGGPAQALLEREASREAALLGSGRALGIRAGGGSADQPRDDRGLIGPGRRVLPAAVDGVSELCKEPREARAVFALSRGRSEGLRQPAALAAQQPAQLPDGGLALRASHREALEERARVGAGGRTEARDVGIDEDGRGGEDRLHRRGAHASGDVGVRLDERSQGAIPGARLDPRGVERAKLAGEAFDARLPLPAPAVVGIRPERGVAGRLARRALADVEVAAQRHGARRPGCGNGGVEHVAVQLGDERRVGLRTIGDASPAMAGEGGVRRARNGPRCSRRPPRRAAGHRSSGPPCCRGHVSGQRRSVSTRGPTTSCAAGRDRPIARPRARLIGRSGDPGVIPAEGRDLGLDGDPRRLRTGYGRTMT